MLRFVVLAHDWPCAHWDFLIEAGPVLRAWRLFELPRAGGRVRAEGAFHGVTGHGERIFVRIPPFEMTPPPSDS